MFSFAHKERFDITRCVIITRRVKFVKDNISRLLYVLFHPAGEKEHTTDWHIGSVYAGTHAVT
jgi:hypothetical protein